MYTWSVLIPAAQVDISTQSGSFDCNKYQITSFEFVEADKKSIPLCPYKYLMIDMVKWYEYWESDPMAYLPQDMYDLPVLRYGEIIDIAQRLRVLGESICNSSKVNSPSFTNTSKGARLSIEDGRHRIHLLRSLGIPAFPAAVPLNIIGELEKCGLLYYP